MSIIPKEFCPLCYSKQPFDIREETREISIRGISFSYPELYAVCKGCGNRIYSAVLNDKNVYERQKAYYAQIDEMKGESHAQTI